MPKERERSLREQVAGICGWVCPKCKGEGFRHNASGDWIPCRGKMGGCILPEYDTSADAALEAYAVLRERGWRMSLEETDCIHSAWRCILRGVGRHNEVGFGEAPALAICEAIVAAHGREKA